MGIPEREEREKGTEKIFEMIMTANFPKLMSDSKELIQEAQRTPNKWPKNYTKAYQFQTTDNQRKKKKRGLNKKALLPIEDQI